MRSTWKDTSRCATFVTFRDRTSGVLGLITHSYYSAQIMAREVDDPDAIAGIPNGFDPLDFAAKNLQKPRPVAAVR